MKNFRTYQLAVKCYKECYKLKLDRHLKDQMLRASSSVVLNLAEGSGKSTLKDRRRFFQISFGSLREVQAIMDLHPTSHPQLVAMLDTTAAHLYRLLKSMEHS